jgi:hypothetical protein
MIVEIRTRCTRCSKLFTFLPEAGCVHPPACPVEAEHPGPRTYAKQCPFCYQLCIVPHPVAGEFLAVLHAG